MGCRIILLGPPGAGKGTQASLLAERMDLPLIITGDLLRSEVQEGSELGREAQAYLDQGKLVPDKLVVSMIREQLDRVGGHQGFILDGFPRNGVQAQALDEITEIDQAILIDIPREDVIKRLSSRRVCAACGAVFNLVTDPPSQEGTCDECGGELTQRSDDTPDVVARRYDVQYNESVKPLIDVYRERDVLVTVDGRGPIDAVTDRLLDAIC